VHTRSGKRENGEKEKHRWCVVRSVRILSPPTFDDPERAGLERHHLHAVLEPVPARLQCNTDNARPPSFSQLTQFSAVAAYLISIFFFLNTQTL